MKRSFALAHFTALALAVGTTFAFAQTGNGPKTASAAAGPDSSWERTHRASKIIGTEVINRQGEKVGDIEDIVLDRNGVMAYAVVSTGGFLGVGDKLNAVPWRSLQTNAGTDHFMLDVDKDRLSKAPGFDSNRFPDMNDAKWSAENRKHFPIANSSTRSTSSSRTTGSEPGASQPSLGRPGNERKQPGGTTSNVTGSGGSSK